ncbi:RNA-binding transcriptional accessory protein [bacterium]|jgi:protein Tex|nr:RNA-binding transcriptional accessory protein [bacterium]
MINSKLFSFLCEKCSYPTTSIKSALLLFDEGATIPFIARYRKEKTNGLDETQLREIQKFNTYFESLFDRLETIKNSIDEQGKLTDGLKESLENCRDKQTLEDLYLPFKKRRKTKADIAIENGLEPLATLLLLQSSRESKSVILSKFYSSTGKVKSAEDAIEGAKSIIAQIVSTNTTYRQWIRSLMMKDGVLITSVTSKFKDIKTKFDMYYSFSEPFKRAASHRLLAIRRGEKEKVLGWKIKVDEDSVLSYIESRIITDSSFSLVSELKVAIRDGYVKSIMPSLQTECFNAACEEAEEQSITVFSKNLSNLLMASPTGAKVVLGIDPGFRTGCKCAVVDAQGTYKETATIFPVPPLSKMAEAGNIVLKFIKKYKVELIAIGNGTGSKETFRFIKDLIKTNSLDVIPVVVNEAGASVYSASELAIEEYPSLDVTVRGAISIAHRLQDPLSELVKIDPKAIGVGQYQHDVNQVQLRESLTFTTELAVNTIGVDVNTASSALLSYVSGIGSVVAKNIVDYRQTNGPFKNRKVLLKVAKLGPKAYEQCVGFLRIKGGKNALDNSSIHPERYVLVSKIAKDMNVQVESIIGNNEIINAIDLNAYVSESVGLLTLKDIVKELRKPGVDPRAEFAYASFDDAVDNIDDLTEGMELEGVVTNVANFGAFVDIGVHQDGLIHISKLSNTFVKNPHDVISVGDQVSVRVLAVDKDLKRIQLGKVF